MPSLQIQVRFRFGRHRPYDGVESDGTTEAPLHPLAAPISINLNKAPGKPLDPWLKEYCEFLISRDTRIKQRWKCMVRVEAVPRSVAQPCEAPLMETPNRNRLAMKAARRVAVPRIVQLMSPASRTR
jgi:hypothetical protein